MTKKYTLKKNDFGFYQVFPVPSKDEITKFYAEEFYTGEYKNFNDSSLEVQIKDPDFYEFLRTLETYEKIIDKKTTLVLPGDSKLFKKLTR